MSAAIDVNILLYASDASSPHHVAAVAFLESAADGNETMYFAWPTLMGYVRMVTHPRIFAAPLSPGEAMANVDRLLGRPNVRVLSEAEGFWHIYREVAKDTPIRGNLVPDAHLAAILKQHGVRKLYTHDRDFLKFPFLRIIDPFALV